jgi:hypothetical protein
LRYHDYEVKDASFATRKDVHPKGKSRINVKVKK